MADRGYDPEANRRFAIKELDAEVNIPLRKINVHSNHHVGKYRHRQEREFDHDAYRKRVLAETVNSTIKRTMRSIVLSRSMDGQEKEVALRLIVHNARRAATLS